MENYQKTNLFKIPIDKYEEDMNTELAKGKKKEILDLFTNYNKLCSNEELDDIEYDLHLACSEGDVELIKIYLSKTVKNYSQTLKFKIDETNQTASLFKVENNIRIVVVPRTVEYESVEYLITSISGTNDNIKKLEFADDSAVTTIYGNAFPLTSKIKEIYFPASLKELKKRWLFGLNYLKKIIIPTSNDRFMMKEDKYLVGKSDPNKDEFDILLFAKRDITEISIPSNIKIISSYAFQNCRDLTKVDIPTNSNLEIIEECSFLSSNIREIFIPSNLKELRKGWCNITDNLTKISISPSNGQFKIKENKYLLGKSDTNIDEFDVLLFACRNIKEISIPSNIKIISSHAFQNCYDLTEVEISANSNLEIIEESAFQSSGIEEIFIPSKVSKLCESAFESCSGLQKVRILPDSNLQIIESSAFSGSNIREFFIPSKVSKICEFAFHYCRYLTKVEIPVNSNLQTIESDALWLTKIREIYFPPNLKELKNGWCDGTTNLAKIIISPLNGQFVFREDKYLLGKSDTNKDEFDVFLFARRDIKEISIPSNIKIISSYAFNCCKKLTKVEIPANSNLQTIGYGAFYYSHIEEIFIPSNVIEICDCAFYNCINLKIVEISEESKLESFPFSAFSKSTDIIIMIPSSLEKLICTNKPI